MLFRSRFVNPGGVPVLLVLDEAAQLAGRVDFESLLSVAREARLAAVIAVQDVAQFKDENQRSIIFANCGTAVFMPRTSSKPPASGNPGDSRRLARDGSAACQASRLHRAGSPASRPASGCAAYTAAAASRSAPHSAATCSRSVRSEPIETRRICVPSSRLGVR